MKPYIIYEDEWMCVIDKPCGMVTNDAESTKGLVTVQSWFMDYSKRSFAVAQDDRSNEFLNKGGVVHRLDKDTSGILVLAKTPEAYEGLKQQFLERTTIKKYAALVHGKMEEQTGEISTPIERHPVEKKKFFVGTDLSKMSITEWKCIKYYVLSIKYNTEVFTLMELTPHTGRTHQLRVHMQYLHHPIVSDPIYGYKKTWQADLEWCPRLFLHARYLFIKHPITGEKHEFTAQLPADLSTALDKLLPKSIN